MMKPVTQALDVDMTTRETNELGEQAQLNSMGASLDEALPWMVSSLLDGEVEASSSFFSLSPSAQFLAIQALRIAARAAIRTADIDDCQFIAATVETLRRWLMPGGSEQIHTNIQGAR